MRVYLHATIQEFISDVREQACKAGAPPLLIDKLDDILDYEYDYNKNEAELEKVGDELAAMEENRNDLAEALGDLLNALPKNIADLCEDYDTQVEIKKTILNAQNALKRSGG